LEILQSVLPAIRVEVRAGGFEGWRIALRELVDVQCVLAGRQILEFKGDGHPARGIRFHRYWSRSMSPIG
jgi:hypothetical protein